MAYERYRATLIRLRAALLRSKDDLQRKRSWRASEKAMAASAYQADITTLTNVIKILEDLDNETTPENGGSEPS